MSWRTVIISSRCKLDMRMGCMVIRSEEIKRISLDEIAVLMIENAAVSITGCLLNELAARKIKVVFCDEKRNPAAELAALNGSHDSSAKIRAQIKWREDTKQAVWTAIVSEKIAKQAELLQELEHYDEADLLRKYIEEIELNDATNREGHAAKVYFNAVFGSCFARTREGPINAALNYGYSIVLSAVNREVCGCGYLTQLGLFHDNMFNHFNLSCDLMEPFRIVVDRIVAAKRYTEFGTQQKHEMILDINKPLRINGSEQSFYNTLRIYCRSVFDALNDDNVSLIKSYSVEKEN